MFANWLVCLECLRDRNSSGGRVCTLCWDWKWHACVALRVYHPCAQRILQQKQHHIHVCRDHTWPQIFRRVQPSVAEIYPSHSYTIEVGCTKMRLYLIHVIWVDIAPTYVICFTACSKHVHVNAKVVKRGHDQKRLFIPIRIIFIVNLLETVWRTMIQFPHLSFSWFELSSNFKT